MLPQPGIGENPPLFLEDQPKSRRKREKRDIMEVYPLYSSSGYMSSSIISYPFRGLSAASMSSNNILPHSGHRK
jgi:hypothetical protein